MTEASENPNAATPLKLFVSLPMKPDQADRYVTLGLAEIAGARSEQGNSAFFAYRDAANANMLYLFEHWASEEWLRDVHGEKDYYKEMRGAEPEVLDGPVGERFLTEIAPHMPVPTPTDPVGHAQVTIVKGGDDELAARFAAHAEGLRKATGNLGLWLFSDNNAAGEYLLLEHWQSEAARAQAQGIADLAQGDVVLLRDVLA